MKGIVCFEDQVCRSMMRSALTEWFMENARDFPWRKTNAWGRYVSEIMLQQTQTTTVIPYFEAFMNQFPNPESLALASENEVLKAWEGLGFYRRARNLQAAAQKMVELHDSAVPYDHASLRKLPGVGDYTAGALASFLSNARTPAIDGNVWRVMLRIFALDLKQGKRADKKLIEDHLKTFLEYDKNDIEIDAALLNEALIELGATICRPKSQALCELCPWQDFCQAKNLDIVALLPQSKAPSLRPVTSWTVPIIETPQGFLIHERPTGGLLAGLYEFPMLEVIDLEVTDMEKEGLEKTFISLGANFEAEPLAKITHLFSHREWVMTFMKGDLKLADILSLARIFDVDAERLLFVEREALHSLPMPAYLSELRIRLNL